MGAAVASACSWSPWLASLTGFSQGLGEAVHLLMGCSAERLWSPTLSGHGLCPLSPALCMRTLTCTRRDEVNW